MPHRSRTERDFGDFWTERGPELGVLSIQAGAKKSSEILQGGEGKRSNAEPQGTLASQVYSENERK